MPSKTIINGGNYYYVVQGRKVVVDKELKVLNSIVSLQ